MSAEAQARLEDLLEASDPIGSSHARSRRERSRSASIRPVDDRRSRAPTPNEPSRRDAAASAWNVLAEEIVSFPRPVHRLFLDLPLESDLAARPGSLQGGRQTDEQVQALRSLSYGERWLERELLALQYRADQGYPEPLDEPRHRPAAGSSPVPTKPATIVRHLPATSLLALAPSHSRAPRTDPRGLRRLLPGVATLAVLAGMWVGLGALSGARQQPLAVLPGSVRTPSGFVYVARPGDTLWSIASRLEPGGDPRPLVAQLERELHGEVLVPGARLVLP